MSRSARLLSIIVSTLILGIGVAALTGSHASVSSSGRHGVSMKELMTEAKTLAAMGKQDSAMLVYSRMAGHYGEEWLSEEDKRLALNAMGRLGYIYLARFSDYTKSYEYLMRALTESERLGFKDNIVYDDIAMAILYRYEDIHNNEGKHTDAVFHLLRKAFNIALEIKDYRRATYAAANMATFASGTGTIGKVRAELAEFSAMDIPDSMAVPVKALCKGIACLDAGEHDKAMAHFLVIRNHNDGDLELYYSNMADACNKAGDMRKAVAYMDSLKALNVEQHDLHGEMQACNILYGYHTSMGNKEEAMANRMEYFEVREKIHSLNSDANIKYLQIGRQLEQTRSALDKATTSDTFHSKLLSVCAILFAASMLLIVVMLIRHSRQRRHDKDISTVTTQPIDTEKEEAKNTKYSGSRLSEDEKDGIFLKIRHVMLDTTLICQTEFSLNALAVAVGERPRHVSQVINEKAGMNFHSFLNEYRMKEACRRISDVANYGHLSIGGIGDSVGIKSRSQFTKVFKRFVGMSPSEYSRRAGG